MRSGKSKPGRLLVIALIASLAFSACRPEDTLDVTPSATPTPIPTATPSPTPAPEGFQEAVNPNEATLNALIERLPTSIGAGATQWKWDYLRSEDGVEALLGMRGSAAGKRVYYTEQTGGKMSLNFAIFDTAELALANYERILDIRSVLDTGAPRDDFPAPNIFGAGLYGSVSIFQIDNYFIEVNIELFSSTQGNPLTPLSRATISFFENNRAAFEAAAGAQAPESGSRDVVQAVLDSLPNEILTDTQWRRDYSKFDGVETPPNVVNGKAARVYYRDQAANVFNMTFGQFDTPADASAHYEKIKGIREGIETENTVEEFPQPHVVGRGLYGSVALIVDAEFFLEVLVERAPGTSANPTVSIARRALAILEDARSG